MTTTVHSTLTLKHEFNSLFTHKLECFINTLCDKYGMTPQNILDDWKEFNGKDYKVKSVKNTNSPSIQDLKEKCREYGLKVGGKKKELEERIRAHESGEIVADSISIKDLKAKLKSKGMKISGNKDELLKRLNDGETDSKSDNKSKYNKMKLMELRLELKTRGCKTSGNKEKLISRLEENDKDEKIKEKKLHNYYRRMNEAIEEKGVYNDYGPPGLQSRTPQPVKELPAHVKEFIDQDEGESESDCESDCEDDDYVDMTIKELKRELKGRALSRDGEREDMIKRLEEDDEMSDTDSSDSDSE